jgi:amidohydrolase
MNTIVSKELEDWAIGHRRYLHQHPELSGQEYETCKYIKRHLKEMDIEILNFQPPNLVGYLKGTEGAKTIALRADIDALPIMEEGDKPYISKVANVAHACGHDGHTSILLAAAKWMSENRDQVKHNIVFIFQSSEEMSPSGAEKLVKEGVLEQVDAVFGLHLMSSQPKGTIGVCHGPMMASSDDFEITITGKGGHGSAPHETVDPTYVAGHILTSLQSIVSRRINPVEPVVISVGQLIAGTSYNIIPNEVVITGTFRTFSEANRKFIIDELTRLVERMSASFGASGEVKIIPGTPPVVNDHQLSTYMENIVREVYGEEVLLLIDPVMGSEDFSFYQQEKPGGYIIVGMGGEKSAYPHHHPKFDIDEEEIGTAIDLFLNLVKHFE